MRRAIAVGAVAIALTMSETVAAESMRPEAGPQPSLSQMAPQPWRDAGADSFRVVAVAAGAVVGVIVANYLSGGLITPILAFGTAATPSATLGTAAAATPAAAGIGLGMGSLFVAAPAAMASMGMMTPLIGAAAPATVATAGSGVAAAGAAAGSSLGGAGLGMGLGMGAEMTVMVAAPTTMANVGEPIDRALRDGYTTPTVLLAAIGESADRAGTMILHSADYLGTTVNGWLSAQ
jgi:hypothetical protein